jgi:hypothetical protein
LHRELGLEAELEGLNPKARDFVLGMCSAYIHGTLREQREGYKETRRTMTKLAGKLTKLEVACQDLARRLEVIADDVREAHIPFGSPVPGSYLMGLRRPLEYFRVKSLPDPSLPLEKLKQAINDAAEFLARESKALRRRAPRIKALWKTHPMLWWQKGGFEYALNRIFT